MCAIFCSGSLSAENGHSAAISLNSTSGPLLAISMYVSTYIASDGHLFLLGSGYADDQDNGFFDESCSRIFLYVTYRKQSARQRELRLQSERCNSLPSATTL